MHRCAEKAVALARCRSKTSPSQLTAVDESQGLFESASFVWILARGICHFETSKLINLHLMKRS